MAFRSIFLEDLQQLEQTSTVDEFLLHFEAIRMLIEYTAPGIPEAYFASLFVNTEVQAYVEGFLPFTVIDAYYLSCIFVNGYSRIYKNQDSRMMMQEKVVDSIVADSSLVVDTTNVDIVVIELFAPASAPSAVRNDVNLGVPYSSVEVVQGCSQYPEPNCIPYVGPSSPSNTLQAPVYSFGMHITAGTPLPNQHCSHRASMPKPICSLLLTSITTAGQLDFSTTSDMIKMYKAGLALHEISIGSESAQLLCAVPIAIRLVRDRAILISDSGYAIMSRTKFSATNTSFTIPGIGHVGLFNVPGFILIVCAHHGLLLLAFVGPHSFGVDLNASLKFSVCSSSVKAIADSKKGVTDNGVTLPATDLVQCCIETVWWNFVGNIDAQQIVGLFSTSRVKSLIDHCKCWFLSTNTMWLILRPRLGVLHLFHGLKLLMSFQLWPH